jgi:membrane-bound serine protease (ClpP class)
MAKNIALTGLLFLLTLTTLFPHTLFATDPVKHTECYIWVASVSDTINPMVAEYISELIRKGEKAGIRAVMIELDTPGGLVESTRQIVVAIMNARIPVITYISPHGARAASAGMFITIASHVAAMAPATNIGAAHPVSMGPMGPVAPDESDDNSSIIPSSHLQLPALNNSTVMDDKLMNDLLAWARTIAEKKNRNIEWVERAIRDSISSTEREALDAGVIDIISADKSNLIQQLQGRIVSVGDEEIEFDLSSCTVVLKPMTWRQKFLSALINPTLAIYLLALGGLGLYFELSHPGFIIPGVVGGISLILGLFAMHTLPINTAGLLLILLSFVFFALEVKMPSYGVLTIGGIASFTLGSAMLVDTEVSGMQVSLRAIIPLAFAVAVITIILIALVVSSHRKRVSTGDVGLMGRTGMVTRALSPYGQVYIRGEIWSAKSSDESQIPEDTEIIVTNMSGLTLIVEPVRANERKE